MYSKFSGYRIPAGDSLRIEAPRAGGYGRPLERDVSAVGDDVRDGLLSITQAREDYGVVIDPVSGAPEIEATVNLRAHLPPVKEDRG